MLLTIPIAVLGAVTLQVAWFGVKEGHFWATIEALTTLTLLANLPIPLSSFETPLCS